MALAHHSYSLKAGWRPGLGWGQPSQIFLGSPPGSCAYRHQSQVLHSHPSLSDPSVPLLHTKSPTLIRGVLLYVQLAANLLCCFPPETGKEPRNHVLTQYYSNSCSQKVPQILWSHPPQETLMMGTHCLFYAHCTRNDLVSMNLGVVRSQMLPAPSSSLVTHDSEQWLLRCASKAACLGAGIPGLHLQSHSR